MSYIFESFKDWKKKVNEDKIKIENEIDQTMTIKVINSNKFRVKARWGGDVVDAMGNLTQTGWNRIVEEIRRSQLSKSLPGINDFTKYVAVYRVIKDTDTAKDDRQNIKKQFFEFDLVGRPKGLPANIEYTLDSEISGLISQGSQNTGSITQSTDPKQGEILGGTSNKKGNSFGLNFSKGAILMANLTDPKLVALIDSLYFKVIMDGSLAGNPQVISVAKGVKSELKVKTLGDNSKTLVSALNAAFSISTRYGDPEDGITQTLINSVAGVKGKDEEGVALSEVDGFNMGAFLAALKPVSDIKVPAGGFVKGKVIKDPEFIKFQQLLAKKFQKSLGSSQIYKNFAKFKTAGADGTYGSNTANLVGLLKNALSDPKWSGNMDKNSVDQAFVDRINQEKVAESYIGLDGFTLMVEGIDMAAVQSYEGGSGRVSAGGSKAGGKLDTVSSGKKYLLQGKDGFEYFVKDSVWHYKQNGGPLQIVLNGSSIKELINTYPSANGYYILTYAKTVGKLERANKHLYKLKGGTWYIQLFGMQDWQKVKTSSDVERLNTLYLGKSSGATTTSEKVDLNKLDDSFIKLGMSIKKFVENPATFDAYKGNVDDDESSAWNDVLFPQWKSVWKKELNKLAEQVKSVTDATAKHRYKRSFNAITKMFTEDVGDAYVGGYAFYDKFHKGNLGSDTYELKLYLGATSIIKLIKIDCDF